MSQAAHPTVAMPSFFDEGVAATLPEPDHLKAGLTIERVFSKEGENPFDSVVWHTRDAAIRNPNGEAIFEQKNVEFPTRWSQLASNVVTSKYFYGDLARNGLDPDEGGRERSLRQLIHRVTRTIADWGLAQGYFASEEDGQCFYDELTWLCVNQYGAFNSPVWFNVGLHHQYGVRDTGGKVIYGWDPEASAVVAVDPYERPQASACFIISVDDSIDDIWQLMSESARLFKFGSGVGADWSTLRSSKEKLSGGGTPSGPVSFMRVQDATGGTIKSGGKCLAPYTKVYTERGPVAVEELAGRTFYVLSYDPPAGRMKVKRAQAWRSGRKEVVRIHTDKGHFDLSFDHPVKLSSGVFELAGNLEVGQSLFQSTVDPHEGYVRVSLRDGNKGRELLHRMVAADVLGLDVEGMVVHHQDENKLNNNPNNLRVIRQAEHAALHGQQAIADGIHVFLHQADDDRFDQSGSLNGMHTSSRFWQDQKKVEAYKERQRQIMLDERDPVGLQEAAVWKRYMNLGYRLINTGHDISTLDKFFVAYEQEVGRIDSKPRRRQAFETQFGGYDGYLCELAEHNHRVIAIEWLGEMDVYSIEVECPTTDDKSPQSGHNYLIWSGDNDDPFGSGIVVSNTRRAAIMQTLKVWHPDVMEFVEAKQEEERKAWALIEQGYDGSFNGPAYGAVAFQNVNQSVRVTDDFMTAAGQGKPYGLRTVLHDRVIEEVDAAHVLHKIAEGTHVCGDPGVQYEDTIQRWHTCKTSAPINSSNPCCFTGDTLVDTTAGQVAFEDLHAMAALPDAFGFDLDRRLTVARPIKRVWVAGETNQLAVLRTEQGLTLRSTVDHRYLTHGGEYVEAQHLKPGAPLRTVVRSSNAPDAIRQVNYGRVAAGVIATAADALEDIIETAVEAASDHVASVEIITLDAPVKVYDMEVEDIHNFSVTASGTLHAVVVHNSEYMFLDDSACNLASLNLRKFQQEDGSFDVERFRAATRIYITAMEILVDNAGYPSASIAKNSRDYRPLGLGFANLGALLMAMGLPYDSDEGRAVAGAVMAIEHAEAYARSAEIAANPAIGPFAGFAKNREPMLDVMQMHHDAVEDIHPSCPDYLVEAARDSMDRMLALGERHGYRNAQSTVLAPTGTIAFMMDCDTTGVEPDIALVKYKLLAGKGDGMLKIVNQTVPEALRRLGYGEKEVQAILAYVDEHDTIEGAPELKGEHLAVFDCAFKPFKGTRSIHHAGHIKMMAATQPFISGAISKTVNMPEDATIDDIADAYAQGWKLGLKALAIYRENSKRSQPLSTSKDGNTKNKESVIDAKRAPAQAGGDGMVIGEPEIAEKVVEKVIYKPVRKRLPDERPALTHKFSLAGHEGYLHVGLYPDTHMPGEIFITMAKQGSTISGLMDAFATSISIALQYGVPLEDLCSKFSYMRFEPSGFTNNRQIPMAKSIMDYIFRYLSLKFLGRPNENGQAPDPEQAVAEVVDKNGPAADETQMTLPFDSTGSSVVDQTIASFLDKAEHAHATEASIHIEVDAKASFQNQADAPPCSNCGAITVRSGACYVCVNCGASSGCG